MNLSDSNNSVTNVFPLPFVGAVYRESDESRVTYGLGLLTVGGFSVNFPGSLTNPILMPPPPAGLGVGPIYSQYQIVQFIPTIAWQVTDRLSVAFSPIADLATLSVDPGFLAAPDDANGNGVSTYPALTHGTLKIGIDAPLIASVGAAYTGYARTLLAIDARYVGYRNTRGFLNFGFGPDGAVQGLGWSDIFALSTGAQYLVTDALAVRMGYSFNTNPIQNDRTFFNIMSPLVIQHGVSIGGSYSLTACLKLSLAYSHFFENTISGPMVSPIFGPLPGTSVTASAAADAVTLGATFLF
ncbi:MAG: outer membrane protein transport protein [Planctomycetia bacterium]|nr:outer membrane protein transport protein [Planctomycetia bacterium]